MHNLFNSTLYKFHPIKILSAKLLQFEIILFNHKAAQVFNVFIESVIFNILKLIIFFSNKTKYREKLAKNISFLYQIKQVLSL